MKQDAQADQPLQAALVVSRVANGLPAEGFFDRARRLGVFDGCDPHAFHQGQLRALFNVSTPEWGAESARAKSDSL